jgi:uncharacterized membrane protein YsdA (DUF1294 family)
MKYVAAAYVAIVALTSLAAFAAYGWDKRRARRQGRRVPENTLHLLALLGGWPGALAGQRVFRHKTQKLGFRVVFWLVVVLHLGVMVGVFALLMRR